MAQVALAFAIRDGNVIAIPKAGTQEHVRQNAAALHLHLEAEDMEVLDAAFPPPSRKVPLSII